LRRRQAEAVREMRAALLCTPGMGVISAVKSPEWSRRSSGGGGRNLRANLRIERDPPQNAMVIFRKSA
jgi:hypothetical protein